MNHIMLQCAFAREVWLRVCTAWGKPQWAPTATSILGEWCATTADSATDKKDARTLIVLVLWELWKHRNGIVFEGDAPSIVFVIHRVAVECTAWKAASLLKVDMDRFLAAMEVGNAACS